MTRAATTAKALPQRHRVGGARPSQMMYAYGVGAQVDLPNLSVVVAGLDAWDNPRESIIERRVLTAVRDCLGGQVDRLAALPWLPEEFGAADPSKCLGVPVLPFPRWMRCTMCSLLTTCDSNIFTLQPNRFRPQRTRYVHSGCTKNAKIKNPTVVPARFVLACAAGHLDDFPWREFVHGYRLCPKGGTASLEMRDGGSGMRSTDVVVHCTACDRQASMRSVYARSDGAPPPLPRCRGRNIHLRNFDAHGCSLPASPMLLGASNMWFAETRSAIALPPSQFDEIERAVDGLWELLEPIPARNIFDYIVASDPRLKSLSLLPADQVWQVIEDRRTAVGDAEEDGPIDLKRPEWERFVDPTSASASNDFEIAQRPVPQGYGSTIAAVTAVTRLREVVALVGFARIEPPDSGVAADAEADLERNRAKLSQQGPFWVPASEMRGEGFFLRLDETGVSAWVNSAMGNERIGRVIAAGGNMVPLARQVRYMLLHSLSHLIVNAVALDCGYSAASIRERIYADDPSDGGSPMAGILFYTAAPDAEGTLGGLVSLSEPDRLQQILNLALRRAEICASDPMCAEHVPDAHDASRHGAACHACLFLPETSCESGNRLLDRSVLRETLAERDLAFFRVAR
jgi:hypothetical protein